MFNFPKVANICRRSSLDVHHKLVTCISIAKVKLARINLGLLSLSAKAHIVLGLLSLSAEAHIVLRFTFNFSWSTCHTSPSSCLLWRPALESSARRFTSRTRSGPGSCCAPFSSTPTGWYTEKFSRRRLTVRYWFFFSFFDSLINNQFNYSNNFSHFLIFKQILRCLVLFLLIRAGTLIYISLIFDWSSWFWSKYFFLHFPTWGHGVFSLIYGL